MEGNNTAKPKYEIIMEDILAKIHANDFSYDKALCTEKMLSEQYNVSRITAKRAITELEQRGILYRKRGAGSFVARNAIHNMNTAPLPASDSKMVSFLLPFDITKGGMFDGIEQINTRLSAEGYFMSIYISDISSSKEKANIKLLLSQNISGLIYYPLRDKINLTLLNEFVYAGIPVVIIDKSPDCSYIHNVVSDNFEGGKLLAKHLIGLGHKNITFFTTAPLEETSTVRSRFGGFLQQMQQSGIAPGMHTLVYHPGDLQDEDALSEDGSTFQSLILSLYEKGVTAIIAENDTVARFIYLACGKLGLRVPEDLSICGFDNVKAIQELGITSINQDFKAIGDKVCDILFASIGNPAAPVQKVVVPVRLETRQSTGAPRK